MTPPPQRTLNGIQYLRAAAAIAVVLSHAAEKTGYHFAIGAAGVDVFFVISGFIMWVVTARREPTPCNSCAPASAASCRSTGWRPPSWWQEPFGEVLGLTGYYMRASR